jgi:hypothetical protein
MQVLTFFSFLYLTALAFSQGASTDEKLKACLGALYQDQSSFYKSSGHYAAHVDLLDSSERSVCFGISLHLSRNTTKDFKIRATAENQTWQVDQKKNLEIVQPKGP